MLAVHSWRKPATKIVAHNGRAGQFDARDRAENDQRCFLATKGNGSGLSMMRSSSEVTRGRQNSAWSTVGHQSLIRPADFQMISDGDFRLLENVRGPDEFEYSSD